MMQSSYVAVFDSIHMKIDIFLNLYLYLVDCSWPTGNRILPLPCFVFSMVVELYHSLFSYHDSSFLQYLIRHGGRKPSIAH